MKSPRRWLDDEGDATPEERALLRGALDESEPPAGAKDEVWAALVAQLGPPGGPGGDGGASGNGAAGGDKAMAGGGKTAAGAKAAGAKAAMGAKAATGAKAIAGAKTVATATSVGLIKSAMIGAGSALALVVAYETLGPTPPDENAPPKAPIAALSAPAAPAAAAPHAGTRADTEQAADPSPIASTPEPPPRAPERRLGAGGAANSPPRAPTPEISPAASAEAARVERESRLREESRLLSEARDALRRGDASSALGLLEQIRAKFPGGILVQEREALAIEALARSGHRDQAASRARAFLDAYPNSPHAARIQAFAQ